jgi:hypothetical protein
MSDGSHDFALMLPFDTDDPEFTRGFQAGIVLALSEPEPTTELLVYATNAEMLARMMERGCKFSVREISDEWLSVEFAVDLWTDGK